MVYICFMFAASQYKCHLKISLLSLCLTYEHFSYHKNGCMASNSMLTDMLSCVIIFVVKTCKEAKHTCSTESFSTTVARTDQLKKLVLDRRTRRDEYAAVISQQLLGNLLFLNSLFHVLL